MNIFYHTLLHYYNNITFFNLTSIISNRSCRWRTRLYRCYSITNERWKILEDVVRRQAMPMVLVTLVIVWVVVISNQTVVINVMNRLILLNVSVKIKCSNCVHYNSCNYRYSDFYDLISLLMILVDLSNKPKQCILTYFIFLSCYNFTTFALCVRYFEFWNIGGDGSCQPDYISCLKVLSLKELKSKQLLNMNENEEVAQKTWTELQYLKLLTEREWSMGEKGMQKDFSKKDKKQ